MIRKLQSNLTLTCKLFYTSGSSLKGLRDIDELSQEDMDQILGTLPKQKQSNPFMKVNATVLSQQSKAQKEITQNKKDFFYGLMPQLNQNYPICQDPEEVEIIQTPNQNIFNALSLTETSSFDEYTTALNQFRTEVDLYGDQTPKSVIDNNSLQFKEILKPDSPYLEKARKRHMVNISIPGTIQCQDPRNFMELRPIQQFRHTPLVPISQSAMKRHKEMLERYHRKQFIFEVKTESILNWMLITSCLGVAGYFIYIILQKEEERTVSFSRLKYQRIMGESDQKPVFRI